MFHFNHASLKVHNEFERTRKFLLAFMSTVRNKDQGPDSSTTELRDCSSVVLSGLIASLIFQNTNISRFTAALSFLTCQHTLLVCLVYVYSRAPETNNQLVKKGLHLQLHVAGVKNARLCITFISSLCYLSNKN